MTRAVNVAIPFTPPMECLPVDRLQEGPEWVYELKLDGYRAQAIRDKNGAYLYSRNGKEFSRKFPLVFAALEGALPIGTALDGEMVAFDENGVLSFMALQNATQGANVVFFTFDVLAHQGRDVRGFATRAVQPRPHGSEAHSDGNPCQK